MVLMIFLKLTFGASFFMSSLFPFAPNRVNRMNKGASTLMISAIRPYATRVVPPIANCPAVSMGMNTEASVPPIPANSVALAVKVLRLSPSVESAGTMPQYEISCMV